MKEELERHRDRMSDRETRLVWEGIRRRAFRPRKSWQWVWAVGTPVAVAAAVLLIFVMARGPELNVVPRGVEVGAPDLEVPVVTNEAVLSDEKGAGGTVEARREIESKAGAETADLESAGEQGLRGGEVTAPATGEQGASRSAPAPKGRGIITDRPAEKKSAFEVMAPGLESSEKKGRKDALPRSEDDAAVEGKPAARAEEPEPPILESRVLHVEAKGKKAGEAVIEQESPATTLAAAPKGEPGHTDVRGPEPSMTPIAAGGPGGRISGSIRDFDSGDPLAYADVIVEGTQLGAASRVDGSFEIRDVPEGTYRVVVIMMGYAGGMEDGVEVRSGKTTRLEFRLKAVVLSLVPRMETIGKAKDIHLEQSSSVSQVDQSSDRGRRFDTAGEASALAGGVTASDGMTHVRGGRSSEVRYYPNGAETKAFYGQPGYPMAHGGVVPPNGEDVDAMFFRHYGVNPFIAAEDDNLSTFAIDVDTGSYTVCRSYLNDGNLPPREAVRVEEFVNFFPHEYDPPRKGDFAIRLEAAPSKFGDDLVLLRVGLKGREIAEKDRKPANLVFVIDTSGSMGREDRLGLVKRALTALVDQMDREDQIGIVEYGSRGRVVLRPRSVAHADDILDAIDDLRSGGSTNAEEGLRLGYEMADRAYDRSASNRVILCSDGVANVGRTGPEQILKTIKEEARRGIYLTAVGFGMGNYNDVLMEQLADHGDGQYYYVDEMKEARRVFTENLTGTLETIARDVKVQVEFNPEVVKRYRLIGYENRDVADRDFRNDRVDAGEVGSGHQVTALYEIRLQDRGDEGPMATVRLRWENPDTGKVTEIEQRIDASDLRPRFEQASWSFRRDAAVAEFAEILRHSYWARDASLRDVEDLLDALTRDRSSDRETLELRDLVHEARLRWKDEVFTNEWRNDDWKGGEEE